MEKDETSVRKIMSAIIKAMVETTEASVYKREIRKTLDIAWHQLDAAFSTMLRALHQTTDKRRE